MRAPTIRMESVAAIHVAEGRRALREDAVPPLMESIKRLGLQVPLAIRVADEMVMPDDGEIVANVPMLVAGRHRLEACRRLGMATVPVVEFPNEADARLWEISENLHRAELSAVERAEHIDEWRRLTEAKVSQVATPAGGRQPREAGIRKTAEALGVSKDAVARAAKIAALPEPVRQQAREEGWSQDRLLNQARGTPKPPPIAPDPLEEEQAIEAQVKRLKIGRAHV